MSARGGRRSWQRLMTNLQLRLRRERGRFLARPTVMRRRTTAIILFASAVLAGACASPPASGPSAPPKGELSGIVLSAPSCPLERASVRCPPRPVRGATVALLRDSATQVESAVTSADGRFHLFAPAGTYTARVTGPGSFHASAQAMIRLTAGSTRQITLVLDSGIR
jgi:hypothetical protein